MVNKAHQLNDNTLHLNSYSTKILRNLCFITLRPFECCLFGINIVPLLYNLHQNSFSRQFVTVRSDMLTILHILCTFSKPCLFGSLWYPKVHIWLISGPFTHCLSVLTSVHYYKFQDNLQMFYNLNVLNTCFIDKHTTSLFLIKTCFMFVFIILKCIILQCCKSNIIDMLKSLNSIKTGQSDLHFVGATVLE